MEQNFRDTTRGDYASKIHLGGAESSGPQRKTANRPYRFTVRDDVPELMQVTTVTDDITKPGPIVLSPTRSRN